MNMSNSEKKSLNGFLTFSKQQLVAKEHDAIVIGNESADLDSIVCSIVYAYYKTNTSQEIHIPVLLLHKDDLCLRLEVVDLLQQLNIPHEDLIFMEDLPQDTSVIKTTLVDHNSHSLLSNVEVVKIIDHHENSNAHSNTALERNIKMVGSCCTLVAEEIYYSPYREQVLKAAPIAHMLLAGIVVDTINLDLHNGRTTELDVFMAEVLQTYTDVDSDQLFKQLKSAKWDVDSMSTRDLLRKDYKSASLHSTSIGISSATIQSSHVFCRPDFRKVYLEFMRDRKLKALCIMFLYFEAESPRRELLVISGEGFDVKTLISHLLEAIGKEYNFKDMSKSLPAELLQSSHLFAHDSKCSRKAVLPVVQNFLESL